MVLKKLRRQIAIVRRQHPDAKVELWAEDEARLGLVPTTRRVWVPRGDRPIALSRRRYQWLYLYGFVHPSSGDVWWVSLPTVSSEAFNVALAHFARDLGVGAKRQVILVIDGAGWHTSNELVIPDGIHFCFLPPYSPELQPAEHLWPLINEAVANRPWEDLDHLEAAALDRCLYLSKERETIHRATLFHWWHRLEDKAA